MTIQETLHRATSRLAAGGIETARLDAEVLLRHVLGVDRTQLFLRYPDALPEDTDAAFEALVRRRLDGTPVAYLTGTREFMALPFQVGPGVLIPRPDTEPLVEWALGWLMDRPTARVADIGTGSGAIAISLAAHLPSTFAGEIVAIDTSPDALGVARRNADNLLPPPRQAWLRVAEGPLTRTLTGQVDLLLANLPYLTPKQISENPDLDAEPRLALDGGADGLDLIREVIADLPRVLSSGGAAGFEIDPAQEDSVVSLLQDTIPDAKVHTVLDLAGSSRHVVVTRS
ncbi:MAG TPA: peptide chain release factor N(5)-glutamine methyltransferase [Thermomicrobiales bacterium]|nr:peptide chain release factor N(5)-glutamine methyltransferase [Thermomicrobiales bacterium]